MLPFYRNNSPRVFRAPSPTRLGPFTRFYPAGFKWSAKVASLLTIWLASWLPGLLVWPYGSVSGLPEAWLTSLKRGASASKSLCWRWGLLLGIVCLGSWHLSYGQSMPAINSATTQAPALLPQRIPPSPTAAALERYGLMPVNESAGLSAVSLPLYEIRSGQLTVPLTLSYHASGIRVSDAASWVGLGWSLNANGVITRVIRGLPDEAKGGFNDNYNVVPTTASFGFLSHGGSPTSLYYQLERAAADRVTNPDKLDYEPDLYTYNFPGQSGCFMLDNTGEYQTLPLKPIAISKSGTSINVVDEHGVKYLFADTENSKTTPSRGKINNISAWYLTRMVSADQVDTIRFTYALASNPTTITTLNQQISIVSKLEKILDGQDEPIRIPQDVYKDDSYTVTAVTTKRLSRIYFKGGYVDFQALANRLDGVGDETLQSLTIVAQNGLDTLKCVKFYHSYFNQENTPRSMAKNMWRLRLDSVATVAAAGKYLVVPPYRFAYNTTPLPDRVEGSRDYWGYPNGAGTSASPTGKPWLVPSTVVESLANFGPLLVGGANRQVNPDYQQAGLLTDIHYPTGGWHHFTYEPNIYSEYYKVLNPRTAVVANATTPPGGGFIGGNQKVTDEQTFSITYPVTKIRASINIGVQDTIRDRIHTLGLITLTDITTRPFVELATWRGQDGAPINRDFDLELPDESPYLKIGHTYQIKVVVTGAASGNIELSYESTTVTYATRNSVAGGVRIREQRIQAAAKGPATIKRYYYNKADSLESSGYLINAVAPVFMRRNISRIEGPGDPNCTSGGAVLCARKSIYDITFTTVSTNLRWSSKAGEKRDVSFLSDGKERKTRQTA